MKKRSILTIMLLILTITACNEGSLQTYEKAGNLTQNNTNISEEKSSASGLPEIPKEMIDKLDEPVQRGEYVYYENLDLGLIHKTNENTLTVETDTSNLTRDKDNEIRYVFALNNKTRGAYSLRFPANTIFIADEASYGKTDVLNGIEVKDIQYSGVSAKAFYTIYTIDAISAQYLYPGEESAAEKCCFDAIDTFKIPYSDDKWNEQIINNCKIKSQVYNKRNSLALLSSPEGDYILIHILTSDNYNSKTELDNILSGIDDMYSQNGYSYALDKSSNAKYKEEFDLKYMDDNLVYKTIEIPGTNT